MTEGPAGKARRWILILAAVLCLCPTRHAVIGEWKVSVVEADGGPVAGIKVGQLWNDYSAQASGVAGRTTDASGVALFPPVVRWTPLALEVVSRGCNAINVHGGTGVDGMLRAPVDLSVYQLPDSVGTQCSDDGCRQRLEGKITLKRIR